MESARPDPRERDAQRFLADLDDIVTRQGGRHAVRQLAEIEGADGSGTVYCTVDLWGDLLRVDMASGWWENLGRDGVARAVLDAWRFARDKAGLARMLLSRRGIAYPPYPATVAAEPPGTLPPYDAPEFAAELQRKADRAASLLERVRRFADERDRGERREVAGTLGLFRVVVKGAAEVTAEVSDQIRPSDGNRLAADARDALLAARRLLHEPWALR